MRKAAALYYLDNHTMESVARRLGQSRSSISRLLKEARETGIVRIDVRDVDTANDLAHRLGAAFDIRAQVVRVREPASDADRLDRVARHAAAALPEWFRDGMTLGVAWGTTVSAIISHLTDHVLTDAMVVQLNGSASPTSTGGEFGVEQVAAIARAFDAEMTPFPVPAFFDFPRTRELMWQERSVQQVLARQAAADITLFGVGSLHSPTPSHVYASGYLDEADRRTLAANDVVGDVCTVFLRADGSWRDIAINSRASGLTPLQLSRIPRRVAVVAAPAKSVALLAALRAGAITDLVLDSGTAQALLRRAERSPRSRG
ncbi:sugar-binding transcriptional regulator [Demequina sp. NBRC 110053]|uniref:sugar-binding transcriptional regulator n=1 Tax=Demequina sp. NBRC 110053 TaxID=1570342 RepID=UPI0009FD31AF|nr:sugar-binding domain-containing protein [Demequina sp. NBRC 110053]